MAETGLGSATIRRDTQGKCDVWVFWVEWIWPLRCAGRVRDGRGSATELANDGRELGGEIANATEVTGGDCFGLDQSTADAEAAGAGIRGRSRRCSDRRRRWA